MGETTTRTAAGEAGPLTFTLERKRVKNLNLRVRPDGSVYVSAGPRVALGAIDRFVLSRESYIRAAQARFAELAQRRPGPRAYVTGERFSLLGEELRLQVEKSGRDRVTREDALLRLQARDPERFETRERLVERFYREQCEREFPALLEAAYPPFKARGIPMPALRIRVMKSRWGSCLPRKGIVTLNRRLVEAPRPCAEYVALHELCHLVHPDHSKRFYGLLASQMPDWRERKQRLERWAEDWM